MTDFFVRLGKSREDFQKLLDEALPVPPSPPVEMPPYQPRTSGPDSLLRQRIERIKRELPIADVIGQYLKLQSFGKTFTGLCPFHEDHNPSFTVFPATGTFHCFSCRKHGDMITFLREMDHLSFGQALDALDEMIGSGKSS